MNQNKHLGVPKHSVRQTVSPLLGSGLLDTATHFKSGVVSILFAFAILPATGVAQEVKSEMFGTWKINWERTSAAIQTVPKALQARFKDVDEFRSSVAAQAKDMTIELLPDQKGFVKSGPDYERTACRWRGGQGATYWIDLHPVLASHGFKMIDAKKATVLLQVDREGNAVVRIPVLFERQTETQ